MSKGYVFAAVALCFLAEAGSRAQAVEADPSAPRSTSWKWTLQVAPTIGDSLPLDLGDGIKDYKNTTKLSVAVTAPFGPLELHTEAGAKVDNNLGDSQKNGSGLFIQNKLSWYRGFRSLSPYLYANGQAGFTDFFDEGGEDIFEYGLGADLELLSGHLVRCPGEDKEECVLDPNQNMYLNLAAQVGRSENSNSAKDYWGPKATLTYLQNFSPSNLILSIDIEYEHRRFDKPETARRRDDQLTGTATLNLARALFPDSPGIKKLSFGGRWVRSWSNYEDGRANKAQFLPVLAISRSF